MVQSLPCTIFVCFESNLATQVLDSVPLHFVVETNLASVYLHL